MLRSIIFAKPGPFSGTRLNTPMASNLLPVVAFYLWQKSLLTWPAAGTIVSFLCENFRCQGESRGAL